MAVEPIKTMKLYSGIDRVFNELRELGIVEGDSICVEDLLPFDQYHYEGTAAIEQAIQMCGINASHHVLEVGSGIGGPARYLAHSVSCTVTALELQMDLHETGMQLTERCGLARQIQHRQGDFLEDHTTASDYDVLVSWLAFLHIPNRQRLFARCMADLKPGGQLFIEDFTQRSVFSSREVADLEHKVYCSYVPTVDEYIAQVTSAGFVNVQIQDMTEAWTQFVRSRLDSFRAERQRHIRVHGPEIVSGLDDFFATMAQLYEGGNLGGLRLVAQKPLD